MSVTNKEIIFDEEVLDELLKGCKTQEDFFGEGGIVKKFVKAVTERALKGELTTHLGYERHHNVADTEGSNSRNGYSRIRQGKQAKLRSRRARNRRALTGEAVNASRRKVICRSLAEIAK